MTNTTDNLKAFHASMNHLANPSGASVPYRIFIDGKLSHVCYAHTKEEAVAGAVATLGPDRASRMTVRAYLVKD